MQTDILQRAALARQLRIDQDPINAATGEPYAKIRVRITSRCTQQVVAGQIVTEGSHVYSIWECDLAAFEKLLDGATEGEMEMLARDVAWHESELAAGRET